MSGDSPSMVCPTCLDLTYHLYTDLRSHAWYTDDDHLLPEHETRYLTTRFHELRASATKGCRICIFLYKGITMFGGLEPMQEMTHDEAEELSGWEKDLWQLCIEIRPGRSLLVSRTKEPALIYIYRQTGESFEFFAKPGCRLFHPAVGYAGDVPIQLNLESCTTALLQWLRDCEKNHEACCGSQGNLPKRVIDIARDPPRLFVPRHPIKERYVTLSHCWGAGGILTTTRATLPQRKEGIEWTSIPQTFRDAIDIARAIDCHYIWIDSLCIVQDDLADWGEQSHQMADIYSGSFLNIAATSSFDSSGGCFTEKTRWCIADSVDSCHGPMSRPIETYEINQIRAGLSDSVCVRPSLEVGHAYFSRGDTARRYLCAPLLNRAWCLQERLLSRRTLHFSASEMIWECRTCMHCECKELDFLTQQKKTRRGVTLMPRNCLRTASTPWRLSEELLNVRFARIDRKEASQTAVLDFWLDVVQQYSNLDLTIPSDRSFALAGIASRVSDLVPGQYVAGLWTADFPRSLFWEPGSSLSWDDDTAGFPEHAPTAPTWSWMSGCDPNSGFAIGYWSVLVYGFAQDSRLIVSETDVYLQLTDSRNRFGSVISGTIKLSGPSVTAKVLTEMWPYGSGYHYYTISDVEPLPTRGTVHADYNLFADGPNKMCEHEKVYCLLLGTSTLDEPREYCLLLRRQKSASERFVRIGIVFYDQKDNTFQDAEVTTISIE